MTFTDSHSRPCGMPIAARSRSIATVLLVSRVATVVILIASVALAYATQTMNISLLVALGFGGLSAALWGPLVLGDTMALA